MIRAILVIAAMVTLLPPASACDDPVQCVLDCEYVCARCPAGYACTGSAVCSSTYGCICLGYACAGGGGEEGCTDDTQCPAGYACTVGQCVAKFGDAALPWGAAEWLAGGAR